MILGIAAEVPSWDYMNYILLHKTIMNLFIGDIIVMLGGKQNGMHTDDSSLACGRLAVLYGDLHLNVRTDLTNNRLTHFIQTEAR